MAQYIDKSALIAELYELREYANDRWDVEEMNGVDKFLDKFIIPCINALETKEIDESAVKMCPYAEVMQCVSTNKTEK